MAMSINRASQFQMFDLLRFPLAILVVLIHCGMDTLMHEVVISGFFSAVIYYFIQILGAVVRLAVPCFFLMSGYLFFTKLSVWDWNIYADKVHRRIYTILIPYIVWNLLTFSIDLLPYTCNVLTGRCAFTDMLIYVRDNIWSVFYDGNAGKYPWDFPLWFLRDLMVMMVLSPLFYFLLRRLGFVLIALLFGAYISGHWFNILGFSMDAFLYFFTGAYLSMKGHNIMTICLKYKYLIAIVSLCSLICLISNCSPLIFKYSNCIFLYSGVFAFFLLSSWLVLRYEVVPNKTFVDSSFFVYAFHAAYLIPMVGSPCVAIMKVLHVIVPGDSIAEDIFCRLSAPILTAFVAVCVFMFLRKYLPHVSKYLGVK